jgi:hypothetical protein
MFLKKRAHSLCAPVPRLLSQTCAHVAMAKPSIELLSSSTATWVTPANQITMGLLASGQGKSVATASASDSLRTDAQSKGFAVVEEPTFKALLVRWQKYGGVFTFSPEGGKMVISLPTLVSLGSKERG